MSNGAKRLMLGAALLVLASGCDGSDEEKANACAVAADCAGQPALEQGQVYACQAQVCTAVAQPYAVYGLKDQGRSVYALGTWPSLGAGTSALFEVFAPEDRALDPNKFQIFAGGYLASDGARLLSGYTKPDVSGKVAVHPLQGGS
ncbi:MAG TPA: hypothetical protein VFO83_04735, partial [Aggregicoccus sp.]|nr:hypothetical protein [Aggregicoccus sp.]